MGIVETVVTSLSEIISGSAAAIGSGITGLLFTQGADGELVISNAGTVIFTLFGLGMGVGLMYVIFGLVVRK